jgi:redox-sensitive bicupin YhaK (pirin superfamily)
MQIWVALPAEHSESAPAFDHYGAQALPRLEEHDLALTVIAGSAYGATSPVETLSELFYVEADLRPGASIESPVSLGERAAYVVTGVIDVGGHVYNSGQLLVFDDDSSVTISATEAAKLMLFGGERLGGERNIWWNFVAISTERIERARRDWDEGRFPPVPGDNGFMPAPVRR